MKVGQSGVSAEYFFLCKAAWRLTLSVYTKDILGWLEIPQQWSCNIPLGLLTVELNWLEQVTFS